MGSHTADQLSKRGYDVTVFDIRKSSSLRDDQKFIAGDMLDQDAIFKALEGAEYLYHFGGIADIGDAIQNPLLTISQNVMGVATALDAAVAQGVGRFVYASSMYVNSPYGSFYRASKQAAEIVVEAYCEKFPIEYTLLRYGSLYGPRAQKWNGLQKYVEQVVRNKVLEYTGTGKERREYIHVSDAAKLTVDILEKRYANQAITVTGQQVLNSDELFDLIFEIAGVERKVLFNKKDHNNDHYVMTPYRYVPKGAKKVVPEEFVDLGQGVFDIVCEIHRQMDLEE